MANGLWASEDSAKGCDPGVVSTWRLRGGKGVVQELKMV